MARRTAMKMPDAVPIRLDVVHRRANLPQFGSAGYMGEIIDR
jgi:hypothetical protein